MKSTDYPTILKIEKNAQKLEGKATNFDWYQGTIFDKKNPKSEVENTAFATDYIMRNIQSNFPEWKHEWVKCKSNFRYHQAIKLVDEHQNRIIQIEAGGNPGVHIITSGWYAQYMAPIIKALEAIPTRVDVAHDVYEHEHTFTYVAKKAIGFAKKRGLKINQRGDWTKNGERGRTLYIGSRTSLVQLRIYEKSWHPDADPALRTTLPNWYRFEFEFKPKDKSKRLQTSDYTPTQWLNSVKWVADICKIFDIDMAASGRLRRADNEPDFERALRHMANQYGKVFDRLFREHVSMDEFKRRINGYRELEIVCAVEKPVQTGSNMLKHVKSA